MRTTGAVRGLGLTVLELEQQELFRLEINCFRIRTSGAVRAPGINCFRVRTTGAVRAWGLTVLELEQQELFGAWH